VLRKIEYNSRRTRGAGLYRWPCQNGCRYSVRNCEWRNGEEQTYRNNDCIYWGYAFSGENHGLHNALLTRR